MIEIKGFAGIMDTDNPITGVPQGFHIMANNVRFRGINGLLRVENVQGTREIVFAKPAGNNECIGAYYDAVDKLLYWFNWNSNNNHCIFQVDIATEMVTKILQSGINTDGDILNFDLSNPIHSIDILYGSDGNFLTYVDSLGRPTEINISLFINTPYSTTKREFIDVAKAPFIMPPKVSYENDDSVTVNNLRNSLFQFRARPIFDNNEKPVYSSGSEVPLPYLPFDQTISQDPTKNSRICIYVQTGDINVKAVEIVGRKAQNGITSDWFKIIVLDKSDLGIADNSIYRFIFLNDSAYPTVPTEGTDPTTQVLNLQDYVPQQANTQALLNGNVFGYAGIIEGYDKVLADIQVVTEASSIGRPNTKNAILFFASQTSLFSVGETGDNITIYLAGVGDNDSTSGLPNTLANSLETTFVINAENSSQVDKTISYTETTGNATIASILAAISAVAVGLGYTQVSLSSNSLVLSCPNIILLSSETYTNDVSDTNEAVYVNAEAAAYAYGVQYFDEKGRTNGVMYGAATTTFAQTTWLLRYELKIYHRPPLWARYYHVVRTKNTTYSKLLTWITDSAYSNASSVTSNQYAYVGITSIKEYNEEISSSAGVVSYEFNQGDRIRVIGRALNNGTVDQTAFVNFDYEVVGTVENPIIDGVSKTGTYVKFMYPANDISSGFKFDGSDDFQNYEIILYGVANRVDKDLELFYEYGLQYGIGNAGTVNAFHAGMVASQSVDLSQPAKIIIDKGDWFYRYRNVVSGVEYTGTGGGNRFANRYSTARVNLADVTNADYEIRSNDAHPAGLLETDYPTYADTDYNFYNKKATAVSVRIKAVVPFFADDDTTVDVYLKTQNITSPFAPVVITTISSGVSISGGATQTVTIDGIYFVPPAGKIWLLFGNTNMVNFVDPQVFTLDFTVLKYNNIPIVEQSFSDLYDLELNADSRATVIDENAERIYYPTKFRWGLGYLQDTNINNVNRFYAANYDEWDRGKGDVRRLVARERLLKVFQAKGVGQTGIYSKFVQDSGGTNLLTTTDDIITKNNINYYQGEYGMGDYPTSLVSTDAIDIFVDPIRGYQIVSDPSGLRAINELYLGQYYIRGLLANYNKQWTKQNGSRAKIMGVYNYIDEEYNCILEGGTNGDDMIDSYNFSFNLKRKGYSSFFDWHPEWSASANEKMFVWKNGNLYALDNTAANSFSNFFTVQYDSFIELPFNAREMEKKGWKGIVQQSNVVWTAPEIYTQVVSYGSVQQESNLVETDFTLKEGMFHASFLRDINSVGGVGRGNKLKGTYIVIKLQPTSSANFVFLASVSVRYTDSPLVPA